jgi:hypothetical protein
VITCPENSHKKTLRSLTSSPRKQEEKRFQEKQAPLSLYPAPGSHKFAESPEDFRERLERLDADELDYLVGLA